jgi:hypothetical protein
MSIPNQPLRDESQIQDIEGDEPLPAEPQIEDIEVPHVPEPPVPEDGVIDPTDTYTEGDGSHGA